jgi:hypothetical protein
MRAVHTSWLWGTKGTRFTEQGRLWLTPEALLIRKREPVRGVVLRTYGAITTDAPLCCQDVAYTSQYPMIASYRKALAQWKEQHTQEYEEAWRKWHKSYEDPQ